MEETRSTLLVRLRDRTDEAAWRTFDQLYQPMLVGYARARGLSPADAEDVAQQGAEAVLKQIGTYAHEGSFRAWLRTIAERRIVDLYRRRREVHAGSATWAGQPDVEPGPPELWEQHWRIAHLRHCASIVKSEVAESTYAAFMAYAVDGQPPAVVAERLGLTVNQVYVAKHRVLQRVRGLMRELIGCEDPEAA